jgi:hypothetical protein
MMWVSLPQDVVDPPHLRKPTILRQLIQSKMRKKSPTSFQYLHLTRATIALSANHVPVRFPLGPSLSGIGSSRFAFVVRLEPQDPTMWFQGARRGTIGTFHERNTTLQKTLEGNLGGVPQFP